jgi:DNA-binding NarL/FixJ family response regulator
VDPAVLAKLRPNPGSALAELRPSLRRVLSLIAQGFSNAAIAERLSLTERTVEAYISNIYQALDVSSERDLHARVRATLIFLRDSQDHG